MRSHLKEYAVNQIGVVSESSFQQKWGTPRQGLLVPTALAKVQLDVPLELPLGRVAVIWYAHLNGANFNPMKARIRPPKIRDSTTVGVFATRGVHRPSSLGLSFCTVTSVDDKTVTLLGADMIVGTPVFAILPAKNLGKISVRMPEWTKVPETRVVFGLGVIMHLHVKYCREKVGETLELVNKILSQDPRSIHSLRKHSDPVYEIDLVASDGVKVWVVYSYQGDTIVVWCVSEKRVVEEFRSRTEPWLKRLKEKIPVIGINSS